MAEVAKPSVQFLQRVSIYLSKSLQVVCDQFPNQNTSCTDKHGTFHKHRLKPVLLLLFGDIFFQLPLDFCWHSKLVSIGQVVLEQEQHQVLMDLHQQQLLFWHLCHIVS